MNKIKKNLDNGRTRMILRNCVVKDAYVKERNVLFEHAYAIFFSNFNACVFKSQF